MSETQKSWFTLRRKKERLIPIHISTMDSDIDFNVQAKAKGVDLFELVCKILGIRESWYFGLQYKDSNGEHVWLRINKKIIDQCPRTIFKISSSHHNSNSLFNLNKLDEKLKIDGINSTYSFELLVKFYPEDVEEIIQNSTLHLFFLQVSGLISTMNIYCPPEASVLLASYSLQAKYGDFTNENSNFAATQPPLPINNSEESSNSNTIDHNHHPKINNNNNNKRIFCNNNNKQASNSDVSSSRNSSADKTTPATNNNSCSQPDFGKVLSSRLDSLLPPPPLPADNNNFTNLVRARALAELPPCVLNQYQMTESMWEDRIKTWYNQHKGMSREDGELEYLKIVQDLDMYGIQYFEIINKKKSELWLGVSALGLNIYERDNKLTPKIFFPWNEIRTVSVDGKRFTIKLLDKNTSGFVFYAHKTQIIKLILELCVGNHDLFLRRRKPDSLEIQQMKIQAREEKARKQLEKTNYLKDQERLVEVHKIKNELQHQLDNVKKENERINQALKKSEETTELLAEKSKLAQEESYLLAFKAKQSQMEIDQLKTSLLSVNGSGSNNSNQSTHNDHNNNNMAYNTMLLNATKQPYYYISGNSTSLQSSSSIRATSSAAMLPPNCSTMNYSPPPFPPDFKTAHKEYGECKNSLENVQQQQHPSTLQHNHANVDRRFPREREYETAAAINKRYSTNYYGGYHYNNNNNYPPSNLPPSSNNHPSALQQQPPLPPSWDFPNNKNSLIGKHYSFNDRNNLKYGDLDLKKSDLYTLNGIINHPPTPSHHFPSSNGLQNGAYFSNGQGTNGLKDEVDFRGGATYNDNNNTFVEKFNYADIERHNEAFLLNHLRIRSKNNSILPNTSLTNFPGGPYTLLNGSPADILGSAGGGSSHPPYNGYYEFFNPSALIQQQNQHDPNGNQQFYVKDFDYSLPCHHQHQLTSEKELELLSGELEKERTEYVEKCKTLRDQLLELRKDFETLKVNDKETILDRIHAESQIRGDNKYSTLKKVKIGTMKSRVDYFEDL